MLQKFSQWRRRGCVTSLNSQKNTLFKNIKTDPPEPFKKIKNQKSSE
jgi:hypothetical protein